MGVNLRLALWLVLADRISKALVRHCLAGESVPLIPRVLRLTYHENTGAAFGLFQNATPFLILISSVFVAGLFFYLQRRMAPRRLHLALHLILAGAVGNLIDRLLWGSVTDFIDFGVWPIFNLADSFITVGAVWLIVDALLRRGRREHPSS